MQLCIPREDVIFKIVPDMWLCRKAIKTHHISRGLVGAYAVIGPNETSDFLHNTPVYGGTHKQS